MKLCLELHCCPELQSYLVAAADFNKNNMFPLSEKLHQPSKCMAALHL